MMRPLLEVAEGYEGLEPVFALGVPDRGLGVSEGWRAQRTSDLTNRPVLLPSVPRHSLLAIHFARVLMDAVEGARG
jgi:hypothetical protein